jgi:transposase
VIICAISDLTDDEWALVESFIPPPKPGGGKRKQDTRAVMNGVMYILSTGCANVLQSMKKFWDGLTVLLSQKVAADARSDSDNRRDSGISRWRLIWISEQLATVNRGFRLMSRGL